MSRWLLTTLLIGALTTHAASALMLEGQPTQGGLLAGQVEPDSQVEWLGHQVPVGPEGHFQVGLGREAPAEVFLTVISPEGDVTRQTIAVSQRRYNIQRINGLPDRQVTPDESLIRRIRDEAARVREARAVRLEESHFDSGWIWPLTGPISGVYGSQRILNGEPRQPHYGVDIVAPTGTLVQAPASGVVTLTEPDLFFSGGTLIIDHGQGLSSSFLHLSEILVEVGDQVQVGDDIARVGATGRVTGAHLDWRMNWFDQRIDPETLVPPMEEVLSSE